MVSLIRFGLILLFLSGCQIGHSIYAGYNHLAILASTESVEDALKSDRFTEEQKRKIRLTQEVKEFAYAKLALKKTKNYSQFADLKRPYVVYNVNASEKWKFEPYLWGFPIIGKAPYIGYYSEDAALKEAADLQKQDYDTSVGGVSAYSTLGLLSDYTLGWLSDPLLSSMLNYSDYSLANTIIHELTHTTLFIKDNINFNERLAVFVANKGTEQFYLEREGPDSPTLKKVKEENEDDKLFSEFITKEINSLKQWYADFDHTKKLPPEEKEKLREDRLDQIRAHFEADLKPKLKSRSYSRLFSKKINNADLIGYNTYMKDLDDFEKVYKKTGSNVPDFLKKCTELKNVDDAEKELHKWASE
ncbi:MAG: aminopeptidase [Pseudobdellovibrio sp.]